IGDVAGENVPSVVQEAVDNGEPDAAIGTGHDDDGTVGTTGRLVTTEQSCRVRSRRHGAPTAKRRTLPTLVRGSSAIWCHSRGRAAAVRFRVARSEEHTSELQSRENLVCRLLLEKKKYNK